jgi:hypothetical protein
MMNIRYRDTLNCGVLSPGQLRARALELSQVADMARDHLVREQLRGLADRYLAIADRLPLRGEKIAFGRR